MICARIETSSAETGWSRTIRPADVATARAIATRCRWPPLKFVWEEAGLVGIESHQFERLAHALLMDRLPRQITLNLQRLGDNVLHPQAWGEPAIRILEYRLDRPPVLQQIVTSQRGDVAALEADRPLRWPLQQQEQLGGRGLTAAALAHHSERLGRAD